MGYKKYVTFSYDDGVQQDIRLIDLFNKYGLKCTFNLNGGMILPEPTPINERISYRLIPRIYSGHEVATHGYIHPHYARLSADEVREDILKDIEKLSEELCYPVLGHAYPYGEYSPEIAEVMKACGIKYARTVGATCGFLPPEEPMMWHPTCHHAYPEIFDLIDRFIAAEPENDDMLLYIWGHSYELDLNMEFNSWKHMEEICRRISGHEDICYVTNMEFILRK